MNHLKHHGDQATAPCDRFVAEAEGHGVVRIRHQKDVRNSAIVREIDEERQRELWTSVGIACLLVLVLLFSAWQHLNCCAMAIRSRSSSANVLCRRSSAGSIGWK